MSERISHGGSDEFDAIVSGVRAEVDESIAYNQRDGYCGLSLTHDLASLRGAFSNLVKDRYMREPGVEMRDEEYGMIAYLMNRTELRACPELRVGDMISSKSAVVAFTRDVERDGPVEATVLGAEDSIVGIFHTIAVVPVPQLHVVTATDVRIIGESYEPVLVLARPVIEDSEGEINDSRMSHAFVPFLDPEARFVKRIYQEKSL